MIQDDGTRNARDIERLPAQIREAFVPRSFTATVLCDGVHHDITVAHGAIWIDEHDSSSERALRALGGNHTPYVVARDRIDEILSSRLDMRDMSPPLYRTDDVAAADLDGLLGRLVRLAAMRVRTLITAFAMPDPEIAQLIRGYSHDARVRTGLTSGRRLGVAALPFLAPSASGQGPSLFSYEELDVAHRPVVAETPWTRSPKLLVARDWLSTAWLFGAEEIDGGFVAGLTINDGDLTAVVVRKGARYRLDLVPITIDGVRFL